MKNNSKTLTIETKKLWITGALLSLLASIYPAIELAKIAKRIWMLSANTSDVLLNMSLFKATVFLLPYIFVIFFLFVIVFILLCKWQSKK